MGPFDEFAQAAKDMEELGDNPPEITQESEPQEQAPVAPGDTQVVDENLSGGLGERTVEVEDAPLSVEDILGISTPSTPPDGTVQAEEEKPAESKEPKTGTDARLSEMSEQLRHYREQNEKLTNKLLTEPGHSGEPSDEQPVELDQDVVDYMAPYIEAGIGKRMSVIEDSIAPMAKTAENQAIADQIALDVEGFTVEDLPKLVDAFEAVPQDQRARYEGSIAGAALLAKKLADGGMFGKKRKTGSSNPLAQRHQTEGGSGVSRQQSDDMSEDEKVRRINEIPGDTVLDMLERMR